RRRTKRSDKRSRRGRMLPPAQRRNASVRGGDWRGDTRAVHQAVQLGRRSCGANRRGNEGLFKTGDREGRRAHVQHVSRTVPLTVKLRGRAPTSAKRRGRTMSSSARGAKQTTPHGPLQRLLEVTLTDHHCARAAPRRQPKPTYPRAERAQGRTRTSDAPNEDACRTTRSASAGISAAPSEGVSCSSRRLSPLSGF